MLTDGQAPPAVEGEWECTCRIAQLPLRPRLYQVYCDVYGSRGHGVLMNWSQVIAFRVVGPLEEGPLAVVNAALAGAVEVAYTWTVRPNVHS
jgi:hypothetical protein